MSPCTTIGDATIHCGDVRAVLATLPEASAQCVVTSPPYWALRDYGIDGQVGLERTPEQYVETMVGIFRGVHRVLRDDGTLWVNIGDCYVSDGGTGHQGKHGDRCQRSHTQRTLLAKVADGDMKVKDLVGIPWMLAFALRADGWYLRDEIIWHKRNPTPESVRDRCTRAHEQLFMFTKSRRYFYDDEAIKEPVTGGANARIPGNKRHTAGGLYAAGDEQHRRTGGLVAYAARKRAEAGSGIRYNDSFAAAIGETVDTRRKRSVWSLTSEPYEEAHFATFPTKLVEPCILAGSRPGDVVMDPFSGAGTTGLVALTHGRRYVGIELNPDYVAMSAKRIAQAAAQLRLAI